MKRKQKPKKTNWYKHKLRFEEAEKEIYLQWKRIENNLNEDD